ncbi:MAG: right-handed parallel beta-helix repeat-containing protein [Bacteroidales bacterium]|nr:right-handed parallel beta-helix repeat-containing protein [Bacteroidales bacterium]
MQAPFVKHALDYYDAVTDGGCDNTGESDCVADILAAVTAYKAAGKDGLYFPAGTYLLSSALTVPDGTTFVGSGMTTAWLQGQVWFGSSSSFTDLKIGPASAGVSGLANTDGASGSSFTRCHFRGGGAESDAHNSSTVNLGDGYDLANLTFTDCEFERSLGTAWTGSADNTHRENTVSIYAANNTVDTVTFDGCDIGVTNGVAAGSQRMGVEVWTYGNAASWWKSVTFTGCHVRPTNVQGLDFACYADSTQADGVLVEGCTIHGAGVDPKGTAWGQGITLEWPKNVTIKNNTFYCCTEGAIYPNYTGFSYDQNLEVTGNTFDFDTAEGGIVADGSTGMFVTHGANGTITGNTFIWHGEDNILGCVWFQGENSTGNTVTGNTFNVSLTQTIGRNLGDAANNGEPWTGTNTVNRS